jgi:hypothetical protein
MSARRLCLLLLLTGPLAAAPIRADEAPTRPKKLFCIVAPNRFHAALKEYVQRRQTQLPTELVSLEEVLRTSSGVDDPEKLKRFLYDAWRRRQLGYVLLVGDVDVMPVRYMVLDRVTPAAFDYAFYPSDLYYADLARRDGSFDDWNARKEGFHDRYFGEVRGEKNKKDPINFDQIDYRPEIAVGRWPVSTEAELRLVAGKSLAYTESVHAGTHPGLRRAELFHVAGWIDARDRLDGLARRLPAGWSADRYFFQNQNAKYKTPPPNEAHLLAALNRGAALAVHVGHGGSHSWDGCFSVASLAKLHNADRLPVLISAGCSTAEFAPLPPYGSYVDVDGGDHKGTNHGEVFKAPPPAPAPYQKKYNPTCLGELALKGGAGGAVVYIGCNTGGQPCGVTLVEGFLLALRETEQPLIGDCWASAVRYYYDRENLAGLVPNDDWYPPSIFFQGMKYMLFGDPTLPFPVAVAPKK